MSDRYVLSVSFFPVFGETELMNFMTRLSVL
nr:MAG TPA: hypothetical protein [Caudoviricetes sp.]DAX90738.1 MAG TPA: hypothetical protein [Caudoviricetes sp.]